MSDDNTNKKIALDLLLGGLITLVITNAVLIGLIMLFFWLDGFWKIPGFMFIGITFLWDWRGIRQIVKLSRGDLSL